ncbi:hypothetical protein JF546_16855 [Nitratireductor aquimarinus]|uniref:hypothetical protein n=1 Tax=Nitratireductor aquimarinus TaxID=889300 RepID=UPI001A8D8959|nr:hypothetical protein [Nitratireductor aquimarinus]MBN8244688.1 hypothetical protein [Nitratireductor aquimarinus]MBY6133075.1 hypothetical protein [Nitratireductor aquimarinus]MCA1305008.1 hypothetical protein [Nitratireductor aquimarinus]
MNKSITNRLIDASNRLETFDRSELRSLLRRAALVIENTATPSETAILITHVARFMDRHAQEENISRDDAINEALIRWALDLGLVTINELEAAANQGN